MANCITKLSELETGHIIETRDGKFYMLFENNNVFGLYDVFIGLCDNTDCLFLDEFAQDFKNRNNTEWDIVAVYKPNFNECHTYRSMLRCLAQLIENWPSKKEAKDIAYANIVTVYKEPVKKLTVSEISELLGYKVEIVEEEKGK